MIDGLKEKHRPNAVIISTTPSFAVRWLLPRLDDFNNQHPKTEVSVLVDQRRRTPDEEGADLSIRMGAGPWPGLDCEAFMDDELAPVASPNYLGRFAADRETILMRGDLLHDRDANASWSLWRDHQGPPDLDVRSGARFTSSDLVLRAAEQGMGIALGRLRLAQDALRTGALARLYPDRSIVLQHAHWIILSSNKRLRKPVRKFIDWLRDIAAKSS